MVIKVRNCAAVKAFRDAAAVVICCGEMLSTAATRHACIIPAAGYSRRMNGWKLRLPFRGRTVIEEVVAAATEACAAVYVVTGYRGRELQELFADRENVVLVDNPDFDQGMFSSIRAGARELPPPASTFVTLADMPWIVPQDYRSLAEILDSDGSCEAARFTYEATPGHPVLLTGAVVEAVRTANPDASMPSILGRFSLCEIATPHARVARDIDVPSDYRST